jgi:hypothetical protein
VPPIDKAVGSGTDCVDTVSTSEIAYMFIEIDVGSEAYWTQVLTAEFQSPDIASEAAPRYDPGDAVPEASVPVQTIVPIWL